MKICNNCNKELPLTAFHRNKSHSDGRENVCAACRNEQTKQWRLTSPKAKYSEASYTRLKDWRSKQSPYKLYAMAVIGAKRQKKTFDVVITVDELSEMASDTSICPICGVTLDYTPLKGRLFDNSPSLDRKDNGDVVTKDSCWIICHKCNRTKSNRSLKEFVEYMEHALRSLKSSI